MTENQNPEQKARDNIDALLEQAGWVVQSKNKFDPNAGPGIAVREYQTDIGPADYVLFVDRKACGVIEAKKEDIGHKITEVESQTAGYATARLKWVNNKEPLPTTGSFKSSAKSLTFIKLGSLMILGSVSCSWGFGLPLFSAKVSRIFLAK